MSHVWGLFAPIKDIFDIQGYLATHPLKVGLGGQRSGLCVKVNEEQNTNGEGLYF